MYSQPTQAIFNLKSVVKKSVLIENIDAVQWQVDECCGIFCVDEDKLTFSYILTYPYDLWVS